MIKRQYVYIAILFVSIASLVYLTRTTYLAQTHPYEWDLPPNLPPPQVPANNPMTAEKVNLGRALFFEPALSTNRAMSCGTCHMAEHAFSEPRATSSGATGVPLKRNALALVNIAYNSDFTWAHNGLVSIEQQMLIPLFSETPIEMGLSSNLDEVLARFETSDYHRLFKQAYGDSDISVDRMVKAIATFVRSLTSFNAAFDDYAYRNQDNALNDAELRGLELFFSERTECFHCHGGFNFTQSSKHQFQPLDMRPFHNTGLYNIDGKGAYPLSDPGLSDITLLPEDMGRFKAPTLRNIALTAPYMHDGSISTLPEVIAFYAQGGRGDGIASPIKSQFLAGFTLTNEEASDLLAFLHSLSDESFVQNPQHHAPINPPKVN
jgi:cytochrome c peroxidase